MKLAGALMPFRADVDTYRNRADRLTADCGRMRIDLATNRVARVYAFDPAVAFQGSYLNDMGTPDGQRAALTISGRSGASHIPEMRT